MTPFGQQIADQIRLNTKRTYFEKMKSQESIVQDFAYGSSPDTSSSRFPTSSPKFVGAHMSPKLSIKSLDHPVIPFHEYDDHSEASQGSFASYIQHENGYIHVLTAQEDVEKFKERKGSRPSVEHEPNSAGDDHSTYIEVLGEDEQHDQSRDDTSPNERTRGLSSHENDYPTYIEVIEEAQDPTYIEVIEEAQGQEGCFGDNRDDGKYGVMDRHQVRREIYEKNESVTQFVMDECVYSNSKRWESLTSQTSSQEGSSVSSENEVFRKELSTPSDVFPELPAKIPNNLQQISENDNSVEESVVESSQAETKLPLEVQRRLQRESQDSDSGEVINSENFSRKENSNTNSWHSGNGSDLADTSETHDTTSSGSESESEVGNSQDSQEICEEEVVGDTDHRHRTNSDTTNLESPSPRDSFDGSLKPTEMRPRSFTTSDVSVLASNETYNPKLLQDLLERMTYPQHFFPANNHPVLKRESPATCSKPGVQLEDEIAAQLMHPTAAASWGTSERARTRHSAGEIKYVCSECGWYKRSRKRSVLKKAKKCERCKKLIYKSSTTDSTRQKSPKSPKKDKGNSIFNRVTRKLRESQQGSVDSFEFDRPDRPTTSVHPKPSFVKQLNNRVPIHNPALNSKLGALGIAPSQARMIKALTIGGDSQTPLRSKPPVQNENTSSTVKNPLTPSFSEGSVSASPVSPPEPERRSPAQATVPKMTSTSPGENENSRVPVTRAASSPVGNMETETTSDLLTEFRNDKASPRKLSGGNLPPLPEVDVSITGCSRDEVKEII